MNTELEDNIKSALSSNPALRDKILALIPIKNSGDTPDTEEKKHVAYSPEVNQIRPILVKYFNEYPADLLADLSDLLSSRDTYWKERVREELGEINFLEGIVGHNNRDIVLENYRKLRDTLLDNLK